MQESVFQRRCWKTYHFICTDVLSVTLHLDTDRIRKLAICGPGALLALNCQVQQNSVVLNRTNQLIESCKGYRRTSKFANENLFWELLSLCRYCRLLKLMRMGNKRTNNRMNSACSNVFLRSLTASSVLP